MDSIFAKINNLTPEDIGFNQFGVLTDAFLMRHTLITEELLPAIKAAHMNGAYKQKFAQLHWIDKASITDEMGGLLELLQDLYRSIHGNDDKEYVSKENRILLVEAQILFDEYLVQKQKKEILNNIRGAYQAISIDVDKDDPQFSKYQLISTNGFIKIYNDKDNQVLFDSRLNKYLRIEVPWYLLTSMELLISNEFIGNIAFKVRGIEDALRLNEDMAQGTKLNLNLTELPDVSEFYSREVYTNKLWVKHDRSKNSITFEELLEDFDVDGEKIVTQVIHLEYKHGHDGYHIAHLDHEYIYYTMGEYENRLNNPDTKGSGKVKTFKLDNSKIPFTYKINDEFFLFQVLDTFLKNKDLIEEYFEDMET